MRLQDQLFNIRDLVRYALTQFDQQSLWYGHGTSSPWDEAVALVFGALGWILKAMTACWTPI